MYLRLFDIKSPRTDSTLDGQYWEKRWHGYYQKKESRSEQFRSAIKKIPGVLTPTGPGILTEGMFEIQLFLNVIHEFTDENVSFMELGAGRGDWSLSFAGVIDYKLIPTVAQRYLCLAVEAEPTHYKWTKDHFLSQNIAGHVLHGAITGENGVCKFDARFDPASYYGAGVSSKGNIEVPSYTIDTVLKMYNVKHLNLIHMDIQGSERDAILHSSAIREDGCVDYLMIGVHSVPDKPREWMNEQLVEMLDNKYKIIINIPPRSLITETPLGQVSLPTDGIMLCKAKSLPAI